MIWFILKWWSILAIFALFIIMFRDDSDKIIYDLKGVKNNIWYMTFFNCVLVYLILPFTIPYSFVRIFNKWIK